MSYKTLKEVLKTAETYKNTYGEWPSLLIEGRAGTGKSSIIKDWAKKKGFEIVDIRLINYSIGDFVLKVPEEKERLLLNLYNEWIEKLSKAEKPLILLLDEIDKADPSIQRMAYQIILDKEVEGKKLSPEVFIIAIQNSTEDGDFNDLKREKPLWDRFIFRVSLDFNEKEWLNWARENLHPLVYTFLEINKDFIYVDREDELVVTPRRWEFLSKVISITDNIKKEVVISVLGKELGSSFYTFYTLKEKYKNLLNNLLDNDEYFKIPLEDRISLLPSVIKILQNEMPRNRKKVVQFLEKFYDKHDDEVLLIFMKILKSVLKKNRDLLNFLLEIKKENKRVFDKYFEFSKKLLEILE
jgi:hypothetical protein